MNAVDQVVSKKASSAFCTHKKNAKKAGFELDYDRDYIKEIMTKALNSICPYCSEGLVTKTISIDHCIPIARGGSHAAPNLAVCCKRCNETKSIMTDREFKLFLAHIRTYPADVKRNILSRLRSGNRFFRK